MNPSRPHRPRSLRARVLLASALLLAAALPAPGAEGDAARQTVIYRLQNVDTEDLRPILNMLGMRYSEEKQLNAIVVHEPAERQAVAREVIKSLDLASEPRASLELTVNILEASRQPVGEVTVPELEAVTRQLASVFGYRGFRVLDSIVLRVAEGGRGEVAGGITVGGQNTAASRELGYGLSFRKAVLIRSEEGSKVSLEGFHFRTYELVGEKAIDRASIGTDVEIAEGQTAVVGKATPWEQDATLVLIVKAGRSG